RNALVMAYQQMGDFGRANTQLKLALELQPNDSETHTALIQCYEKTDNRQGVIDQILSAVQVRRRDIQLYKDLADRLQGNPSREERAITSIVEVLPNETESHTMVAEIRQRQGRWDDAIEHWRRVAELRALEPTGLLKLADAQLHQGYWDDARQSLTRLTSKSWPQRFGDVHAEARAKWNKLDQK
ncbi:MAG: tetratricopeptide repeat protein, partial [Planctomycetales bacterium]